MCHFRKCVGFIYGQVSFHWTISSLLVESSQFQMLLFFIFGQIMSHPKPKCNSYKDPMSYLHFVDKWNNLPSGFYFIWQHAWGDKFYMEVRDTFYYVLFPYCILGTQSKNFMETPTTKLAYTTVTYRKATPAQMNGCWIQKADFSSGRSGWELCLW